MFFFSWQGTEPIGTHPLDDGLYLESRDPSKCEPMDKFNESKTTQPPQNSHKQYVSVFDLWLNFSSSIR